MSETIANLSQARAPARFGDNKTDAAKTELIRKAQEKSKEFEAVFIAEMLKFAQIGMPKLGESGGPSEVEAFEGFMREAYADAIVKRGGFGLAESVAKTMIESALGTQLDPDALKGKPDVKGVF